MNDTFLVRNLQPAAMPMSELSAKPSPEYCRPYGNAGSTAYEHGAGATRLNLSWETHLIWRPHPVIFGLEFKHIKTVFGDPNVGTQTANHVNLAMGFEF